MTLVSATIREIERALQVGWTMRPKAVVAVWQMLDTVSFPEVKALRAKPNNNAEGLQSPFGSPSASNFG